MSRRLNWDKAHADAARQQASRDRRDDERHQREAKRTDRAPTARQIAYIASLAGQLGRTPPEVTTRTAASAAIRQLEQVAATVRRRRT